MRRTEAESGGADSWTMVDPLEQKNNKRKNSTAHQTSHPVDQSVNSPPVDSKSSCSAENDGSIGSQNNLLMVFPDW